MKIQLYMSKTTKTTKKRQRRRVPPKRQRRQTRRMAINRVVLSPCAEGYFSALYRPFDFGQPTCLPDMHAVPSHKVVCRARGSFAVGTGGVGWIYVNPQAKCSNSIICYYTPTGYAGTTSLSWAAAGASNTQNTMSPYGPSDLSQNETRTRVVACALRIRYTGTELNRGGNILMVRDPDNGLLDSRAYATLLSEIPGLHTSIVNRQWNVVIWEPTDPGDYDYGINSEANSTSSSSGYRNMGAYVTGTAGNTFEWDIIQYLEFVGTTKIPATPSPADPEGVAIVRDAVPSSYTGWFPDELYKAARAAVRDYAPSVVSYVARGVIAKAGEAIQMGLGPSQGRLTM